MSISATTTLKIMIVLSDGRERYGAEIMQESEIASGAAYPILHRLEAKALVDSRIEEGDPRQMQRPCRVYYRITRQGMEILNETVSWLGLLYDRKAG